MKKISIHFPLFKVANEMIEFFDKRVDVLFNH